MIAIVDVRSLALNGPLSTGDRRTAGRQKFSIYLQDLSLSLSLSIFRPKKVTHLIGDLDASANIHITLYNIYIVIITIVCILYIIIDVNVEERKISQRIVIII